MKASVFSDLPKSLETGFLDASIQSSGEFRPHLVLNDPPRNKVLSTLIKELDSCTYFEFSVAFITSGGLAMLLQSLYEAQKRGVKGKILTSDYLTFTDPKALQSLLDNFPNIEVKVYSGKAFHAKGYLFYHREESYASLVLGSSNLTHEALSTNREWNVRLVSLEEGELFVKTQQEFNDAWQQAIEVSCAWLLHYERIYSQLHQHAPFIPLFGEPEVLETSAELVPNYMQREALDALDLLRQKGEKKALLISATGTGKTLLNAFDVAKQKPKRFLFIVHRQQIATESMKKFQQILGSDIACGLLGGRHRDAEGDYLFAMIQTLSKPEVLHSFPPDYFDYICVDEVHRSGADSYTKVLDYFNPAFLLGMTATPERSDGFDIYGLFDHNIAYEIRLNQALEADLLCPFHYYGISDLAIDGEFQDDLSLFSGLACEERVKRIKQMIDRYSIGNQRRRGLIFCSRNEEAAMLAEQLVALGVRALALSGQDSEEKRNDAFVRLEQEAVSGSLEYLVSVDIFNEGIDIPSLNQIVMLRPTQSAIVFVQQMGRGLRKFPGKEYLTIIDFIANYGNNYMIPVALFGDNSFKKDALRKIVSSGSLGLSGVSTVSFDKIAKERIYASINSTRFNTLAFLKEEYDKIRLQVGRIPTMLDFVRLHSVSPQLFIEHSKSFFLFKSKVEKPRLYNLSILHLASLAFLSKVVCSGIRPYEGVILQLMMEGRTFSLQDIAETIQETFGFAAENSSLLSAVALLQNGFFQVSQKNSFSNLMYCEWVDGRLQASSGFCVLLESEEYRKEVIDILALGDYEYRQHYRENREAHDLVRYQKYTRQEVCRLLNWKKDESSTLYGYKVHYETKTCPIFVTYHKDMKSIDSSINYKDLFLSVDAFQWETRNNVKLDAKEPRAIREEAGPMEKLLFVKKNNDEGQAFYYIGKLTFLTNVQGTMTNDEGKVLPVVQMQFKIEHSVPSDLYAYLTEQENGHVMVV